MCSKLYDSQVEKDKEQLADLSPTLPTARIQCSGPKCKGAPMQNALHFALDSKGGMYNSATQVSAGPNCNVAEFGEMQNVCLPEKY